MDSLETNVDAQIRAEIERISRDVIDWERSYDERGVIRPHWKPRHDEDGFKSEGKRLVPLDMQVYYDLQLSRGATRKETNDLDWEFENPDVGITTAKPQNDERFGHFTQHYPLAKSAKILELGMRSGGFLRYLQASGFSRVSGIDCVELNVLWCMKNGFDVQKGDVHELTSHFESNSVDAIFAYHVLEHCYDPQRVLRQCHDVLVEGGGIHIEIPVGRANLERAHCYSFSRREIHKMLSANGFDVLHYAHQGRFWRSGRDRVVARNQS